MERPVTLYLRTAELDDSQLQAFSYSVARSLRENGLNASQAHDPTTLSGKKGDPVTVGAIFLALVGTGGVISHVVDVLKAYAERKPELKFDFVRADGERLTVSATDLRPEEMIKTREMLSRYLKD